MALPEILSSIAGGLVTLAGFAAVFQAFSGEKDPDGQSRVRLDSVIEGGLLIAFVSYLPAWLETTLLPAGVIWRFTCLVILLWCAFRIGLHTARVLRRPRPLPELFTRVDDARQGLAGASLEHDIAHRGSVTAHQGVVRPAVTKAMDKP